MIEHDFSDKRNKLNKTNQCVEMDDLMVILVGLQHLAI